MTARWVWRYDPTIKLLRIVRFIWEVGQCGDGNGYSNKLSVGLYLKPKLFGRDGIFGYDSALWARSVTLFGVRFHYMRSYGGMFT